MNTRPIYRHTSIPFKHYRHSLFGNIEAYGRTQQAAVITAILAFRLTIVPGSRKGQG